MNTLCKIMGFVLLVPSLCHSFTSIQTSTSVGFYRSYTQLNRYPIFHSWSLHGIYGEQVETDLNFILNNDFSLNQWKFFPTEAKIDVGLSGRFQQAPEYQSKMTIGRQLYADGFDLFLLDGVRMPLYWSSTGGVSIQGGMMRSLDMDSDANIGSVFGGLSLWEKIAGFQFRGGLSARDEQFATRYGYASFARAFPMIVFSPTIFNKQEWDLNAQAFNQSTSEITFEFLEKISMQLSHSFVNPRSLDKKQINNFVYRVLALSPTESIGGDFNFQKNDDLLMTASGQSFSYLAGTKKEYGDKQDLGIQMTFAEINTIAFVLTNLYSYGGTLQDFGINMTHSLDEKKEISFEFDAGYLKKTNNISGAVTHLRTSYQTSIGNKIKALFGIETERNQYFEFDTRAVTYVTSYL